jgi:hypothetical protein
MSSNIASNFGTQVIDEESKTITIRQSVYTLNKDAFVVGYHHIIYANQINIQTGWINPGMDLSLYASVIEIDKNGGCIDVSGVDGYSYKAGDKKNGVGTKAGTHDGADGVNGKDGGAGQDSGHVKFVAGVIRGGKLEIKAFGGNGGRAQDGGNGVDGKTPPDKNTVARPKAIIVGTKLESLNGSYKTVNVYGWDKDVKEIGHSGIYKLYVAHEAKQGGRGGNGGNAGLPGVAGAGGKGGQINICSLAKMDSPFSYNLKGGEKGSNASFGSAAKGIKGSLGGKYLYKGHVGFINTDWSTLDENNDWKNHWSNGVHLRNFGVTTFVDSKNGHYVLQLRNKPGGHGADGGYGPKGLKLKPQIQQAIKGMDGSNTTTILENPNQFKSNPWPYFLLLQRCAAIALANRQRQSAIDSLQWLIFLTSAYRNLNSTASNQDQEIFRIYNESETALLTIDREQNLNRAKRSVYKDIKDYADFVETSMSHIRLQTKYFQEFHDSIELKNQQINILNKAIAESNNHIGELTGNKLTPGSIVFLQENETQIKNGLAELDLQLTNYKIILKQMPTNLQSELDKEYFKKTQIGIWDLLEFFSMAAGVVINFASAASSIVSMVKEVKNFYLASMELTTWANILKDGIWNREFTDLKSDISELVSTSEFKAMNKNGKSFITSVTDFQGKILAYDELVQSRKFVDFDLDIQDIQASVLIFDMAKLNLKKQRTELESSLRSFLDDYKSAQEWEHVFKDFFDTSITRFNMLAHLADIQAERRQLELQRSQYRRNVETQQNELNKLKLNSTNTDIAATKDSFEANMYLALNEGLERIRDEYQAYRIWTQNELPFPSIKQNLSVDVLHSIFHKPVWDLIKQEISKSSPPSSRDFADTPYRREFNITPQKFKQFYYDENKKVWRFVITIPLDFSADIYFQRLIDAKVYLDGAQVDEGSAFYCILRHRGISRYLNRDKQKARAFQNKHSVAFSYIVENGKPNYNHAGAIQTPFDDRSNWKTRIRYSPFTTWEIEIIPNYKQNLQSKVYNQNIDFSNLKSIEFRYEAFFNSYSLNNKQAK